MDAELNLDTMIQLDHREVREEVKEKIENEAEKSKRRYDQAKKVKSRDLHEKKVYWKNQATTLADGKHLTARFKGPFLAERTDAMELPHYGSRRTTQDRTRGPADRVQERPPVSKRTPRKRSPGTHPHGDDPELPTQNWGRAVRIEWPRHHSLPTMTPHFTIYSPPLTQ